MTAAYGIVHPDPPQATNQNSAVAASALTALSANNSRIKWSIQNAGTNVLTVTFGSYSRQLAKCTAQDDGTGGLIEETIPSPVGPAIWKGVITISGTNPRYNVLEYFTPS